MRFADLSKRIERANEARRSEGLPPLDRFQIHAIEWLELVDDIEKLDEKFRADNKANGLARLRITVHGVPVMVTWTHDENEPKED